VSIFGDQPVIKVLSGILRDIFSLKVSIKKLLIGFQEVRLLLLNVLIVLRGGLNRGMSVPPLKFSELTEGFLDLFRSPLFQGFLLHGGMGFHDLSVQGINVDIFELELLGFLRHESNNDWIIEPLVIDDPWLRCASTSQALLVKLDSVTP